MDQQQQHMSAFFNIMAYQVLDVELHNDMLRAEQWSRLDTMSRLIIARPDICGQYFSEMLLKRVHFYSVIKSEQFPSIYNPSVEVLIREHGYSFPALLLEWMIFEAAGEQNGTVAGGDEDDPIVIDDD